ncbi:hypothetical protein DVH24_003131 [Malus domestica]|uniref:Uncharacterized protein n=1 Tax=Malus domestica TaxID=3750 RepID=A0A498KBZ3_MALDO|nr:hypothetical protein DVH24_003131 [Malus domestica]
MLQSTRARLRRSTILSILGPDYALTVLFLGTHTRTSEFRCNPKPHDIVHFGSRPHSHGFVSGNSHENFPVGHPSWDCYRMNSLNLGVPMEPETSELPKGLVLGRYENIHIKHR